MGKSALVQGDVRVIYFIWDNVLKYFHFYIYISHFFWEINTKSPRICWIFGFSGFHGLFLEPADWEATRSQNNVNNVDELSAPLKRAIQTKEAVKRSNTVRSIWARTCFFSHRIKKLWRDKYEPWTKQYDVKQKETEKLLFIHFIQLVVLVEVDSLTCFFRCIFYLCDLKLFISTIFIALYNKRWAINK